jgi:hypothetical protein
MSRRFENLARETGARPSSLYSLTFREAEAVREGFGEVFPALPQGLREFGIVSDSSDLFDELWRRGRDRDLG